MQNSTKPEARLGLLVSLVVLGLAVALVVLPNQFRSEAVNQKTGDGLFTRTTATDDRFPNYDIRWEKTLATVDYMESARQSINSSAAAVADVRDGFVRGEESLRSRYNEVQFEYNTDMRIPEVISPDVWKDLQYLSPASGTKRSEVLRSFVKENNDLVGVSDQQADSLRVTADYTNPDGDKSFAHLEQTINGIPVFRGEIKAGFTKSGQIIRVINNLAPGLDYGSLSGDFGDAAAAVKFAAANIDHQLKAEENAPNAAESTDLKTVFGSGDWATTAEKMYFPTEPGVAVPAYRVLIWEPVNAYYVIVDAHNGTMLWRKNISNDQAASATYNVYNNTNSYILSADSPAPLSPGPINPGLGTQGVNGTRTNVTLIGNEGTSSFNNSGWILDANNSTDGNAVEAGVDRVSPNGVDAPMAGDNACPGVGCRTFSSPTWNPPPGAPAPGDEPLTANAQRGAVIQMFYVMNRYHDELYKRGFTEQAFNFQNDNFGRGGTGADRVSAEGQDSSGTDNANFSTPADGGRGRMQMYLWTGPTPDYDGTADAEVIIHEVTHGTSNRLHGNSSGLNTNMSGGMGEGWGDFYGYTMLAEPTDPINGVYTTGGYATYLISAGFTGNYYYGIRRFPRAPITFLGTNGKPHNPFTFKYINAGCAALTDGTQSAFPRGPIGVAQCDQVHNLGEIWSSMLWEVRNRMVARLGFAAGTTKVLQVVTDGMKLAPIGPTFIQERNAIIAAAQSLSSADAQDVREGFRVRGMGYSANIISASPANVVEAFDFPNAAIGSPINVTDGAPGGDNDGFPEPGETVQLSIPVTNNTGGPVTNIVVTATGGGVANYGTLADGQTATMSIPYAISAGAACGSTVDVTLTLTSNIGPQTPVVKSFVLGSPNGTVQNFDGVVAPALPAGWTTTQDNGTGITWTTTTTGPSSAPNSAFANDPAAVNLSSLVSPSVAISSTTAQVKFKNKYITENTFDGAVLEISIAGGAWQDILAAGGTFVSGGYNGTLSTSFSNPLGGRAAWTGTSAGGYINSVANLPAAANGQNVQLRWRMASDVSVASTGINVDDVEIISGYNCGGVTPPPAKSRADFDGDGKTDVSVFRPSDGNWYLNRSTAGFTSVHWGSAGDVLVPGDYDNDGKADTAIFRANDAGPDYYILNSNGFTVSAVSWGTTGDVAAAGGDYDGDGKADVAVFRPSTGYWYILKSAGGSSADNFGTAGDQPVVMDPDGDGKANIGVFRPSNNTWYIVRSTGVGFDAYVFGAAGDKAVPADYDGDGKDDVAVFRPSTGQWIILKSTGGVQITVWGQNGDVAAPGDYDGDGKDDQAVFRGGTWYINRSTGGLAVANFGLATDKPIPAAYIP
ncbi:MAG: M36 family metallopeptidase [Acidobacteriota bacterium]